MRHILLIEDELIVAMDIKKSLEKESENVVVSARNYKQAKQAFLETDFNIIICDINLNDVKDGIEIIEELMLIKEVPVVYLTAYDNTEILTRAKETVPYAYLLKPFNEMQLKMTIDLADLNFRKKEEGFIALEENLSKLEDLTKREKEVLLVVATGKTSKEIGESLNISQHTVDQHKKNIKKKLKLRILS
ncbi:DNA-binding response regulator, LuxR family protein [Formosa agariphila KMM 3901]|uniref:DNA-binding response regulator, LuxR family protein n=1 Tax=Formosa agariphila (strain DSM 15362 / KCTC 12365 / LMG 23005 / KMM 3901 / M-2Alg 35-1) TaxID=1347342 RepID=T2KIT4_FORAG|nr:response regulator [Formosa agariphila]CDF78338.1 DNA-binding response regulator, LuxR family protein [Formosa agariphila KMM 3901]